METPQKHFGPTSWAIENRTSIYLLAFIITVMGLFSFYSLPKEQFPEITIPTIYVSTTYPGTSPADMENLVTRPLEKQIKSIPGIKKITSNSIQDYCNVIVEFNQDVNIVDAKQRVKDAVDKARTDLPTDLPHDPDVVDVDLSQLPILFVNMSGDFELDRLKKYADDLKDRIEELPEITRVDEVGAPEHEVQIDVDMYKMNLAQITMDDISRAIASENVNVSAGQIPMSNMKRTIRISGQFVNVDQVRNLVVNSQNGAPVYLKNIAEITYGYKEKESYARLDHKNVITLQVIKRSGENLLEATDRIKVVVDDMQKNKFPAGLKITLDGDQSTLTRHTLSDLINSIVIGFVLVTLILMFFMGVTNALFVALSVPLSTFVSLMILPAIDFDLNMMVLFSILFAIGIIVDDAIVVIENTHRIFNKTKMSITQAAKFAAGEVFVPVLSGTLTTLAPFMPLAFWPGIVGKFIFYLPVTFMITLMASLLVAFIINPVFAVSFMKLNDHEEETPKAKSNKGLYTSSAVICGLALLFYLGGGIGMGNFLIFLIILLFFNRYVLKGLVRRFQKNFIPKLLNGYERLLNAVVRKKAALVLFFSMIPLFFIALTAFHFSSSKVVFFPQGDPNYIYVYIKLPVGTAVEYTDSITHIVEKRVYGVVGEHNTIVDAVIANVAIGATDPNSGDQSTAPNKGKVTVAFKEFQYRNGVSTRKYLDEIRKVVKGIAGAEISVDQENNGPPTGAPIDIEISGDDFNQLIATTTNFQHYLDSLQIPGVEKLKSDLDNSNPQLMVNVDRERAVREGLTTGQIAMALRNAVYGEESSKYKVGEDEYKIMVRYEPDERNSIDALMNMKITFRDIAKGGIIRQVPLSAVATVSYVNSLGGIKRVNLKRTITLSSNVTSGHSAPEVNAIILKIINAYKFPESITVKQGGQDEEQQKSANFLAVAFIISLLLVFMILVLQFNSISKPLIILSEIIFSLIGVWLGFAITGKDFSIVMCGMGIVGLIGIVVKNGILLVDFADRLYASGLDARNAAIQAGKTRITPVLLTASATITALLPLGFGFNIDFVSLFTTLNPHIYFGGDSVVFWGPLSWTIIFGLSFCTFITLILVPCMYYIANRGKIRLNKLFNKDYVEPVRGTGESKPGEVLI
jgi:multidrug efflux pump